MRTSSSASVFQSILVVCSFAAAAGCVADRTDQQGSEQHVVAEAPAGTAPSTENGPPAVTPPPVILTGGDFRGYATATAAHLQTWWRDVDGIYRTAGWWNNANALNAVVDFMKATGNTAYKSNLARTFAENSSSNFLNDYYDDEGWWALAWIAAYDLTNEPRYLNMSKTIFADMARGWDSTCNGGIWWRKERDYKNAIANELFLEVAVRLHLRTPGDAGPGSFIDWATREWTWFEQSGMINGENLINDGLRNCRNNGDKTWTYNQGVVLGGLADLTAATGDARYLQRAQQIADAAIGKLVDANGILSEGCEPNCGDDGSQFKGIFMRNLAEVAKATNETRYRQFIAQNADSIWNTARSKNDEIGVAWAGPFDTADASRQSSALDALNAAIPYTAPVSNLALGKSAAANSSCGDNEVASRALDGKTDSKWCAGATAGTYWLEADLGAPTKVARVILRHAQAGGERAEWNTRDFTLKVDGSVVASVAGNTRPVTVHRFTQVTGSKVRIEITKPQTDPNTVAARIYELEVYEH